MKAITVSPGSREIGFRDVPAPGALGKGQVRVRTLEVGLCGTDKEIARFEYGTPPEGSDFLILGHEAIGEVIELWPGVGALAVGDLVVPQVRRPCPHARCAPCRVHRSDYCVTGDFTERGIRGLHGFACETWVDDAAYLHRVDPSLRPVGVLTEPLTVAEKALLTVHKVQSRLPPGTCEKRNAVVIGSGPIGQLGAMALRRAGFKVHVYARSPAIGNVKAAAAERVGAVYISSKELSAEALARRIGEPELVFEAAGASGTAFEFLSVLAPNGVFVLTGVPGRKQPLELDGAALMKSLVLKNQLVLGTVNASCESFEMALADLQRFESRWAGALEALITHRHAPEEVPQLLREGVPGGIKHVVVFAP